MAELAHDHGFAAATDPSRCLRPDEAAAHLGISRAKLYELIAAGELTSITIGRSRRVPLVSLHEFVDLRVKAATRA